MKRSKLTQKRSGSDNRYVRVQVPKNLQGRLAKKEIWRSLKTADRQIAERLAPRVIDNILAEIENEAQAKRIAPTRDMLRQLAFDFYQREVQSDLDDRASPDYSSRGVILQVGMD